MGTGGHALRRVELLRTDIESFYIAGAGPIGLGVLAMARIRYGDEIPIHISDVSRWRLDFAAELGGVPVDASDATAMARLSDVDVAVDSTGRQSARQAALRALGKRGVLVCVGHGESLSLSVSEDLIAPERAVLGSEYFTYAEMADNLEILHRHRDRLARIITHRMPVQELDAAFETFLAGRTGKVVVVQDAQ
jgi:threonine dehydrogenase-like Zn-dependent dehydrogenase